GTNYGLLAYYCDYNDIDFNSISIEQGSAYPVYLYYGNGVNFRNNVIASWGTTYRYYQAGSQTRTNNVWWAPNATSAIGNLGSNLLNVDPGYKSKSDLHTGAVALYNTGVITTSQTTDIDGDIRCPGTGCPGGSNAPDRGADEYWLPDFDISPVTAGVAPCSGVQNVQVKVANRGLRALTSFTINWSVSGVAQIPLIVYSSNVAAGSDTLVTVGRHTFSAGITYNFEYVTSVPSGNADQQTFNDTLRESMQNAMAGTFSVGKPSSDYPTFSAAVADLKTNGICGPVILELQDTTLSESFTIGDIPGVSSINTITIDQDPANAKPGILDGKITLGDISYLTVKNIVINTSGSAFEIESGKMINNIKIDSNTFNLSGTGSNSSAFYDAHYAKNIDSLWFTNNEVNGGYYAIRIYGGSSNIKAAQESNIYIENNNITSFRQYGLYVIYANNVDIINNDVITNPATTASIPYGILAQYNINLEISKNRVVAGGRSGGYGVYTYYTNYYGGSSDVLKINNNFIVAGKALNTSTRRGIYMGYYDYRAQVYHNNITILGSAGGTNEAMYTNYTRNSSFRNNIFENTAGSTTWNERFSSSVTKDYNAYWTGTAGVDGKSGGARGTNSMVTNPRFKNPKVGDLRVNSLQLDRAAFNVGITEDFFDAPRVMGNHDIGAHEFDVCYFDPGMTDISAIYTTVPAGQGVYLNGTVANKGLWNITGTTVNLLLGG
ncbi:hypothetical protein N8085_07410, partial [Salibacteraceae bacterium]|nr:hypothetical protein [Salibacteraceae bacterium]